MTIDENWYSEAARGFGMSLEISEKLHEEQSPYQKIEIYQTKTFGRLMTLDGLTMVTDRDNFVYHEMMSHPVLFNHPNPKDVAIVGGGDCGTLREVLKHGSVKSAIQIELDECVTRVAEEFFPELCESNSDPRAHYYLRTRLLGCKMQNLNRWILLFWIQLILLVRLSGFSLKPFILIV